MATVESQTYILTSVLHINLPLFGVVGVVRCRYLKLPYLYLLLARQPARSGQNRPTKSREEKKKTENRKTPRTLGYYAALCLLPCAVGETPHTHTLCATWNDFHGTQEVASSGPKKKKHLEQRREPGGEARAGRTPPLFICLFADTFCWFSYCFSHLAHTHTYTHIERDLTVTIVRRVWDALSQPGIGKGTSCNYRLEHAQHNWQNTHFLNHTQRIIPYTHTHTHRESRRHTRQLLLEYTRTHPWAH